MKTQAQITDKLEKLVIAIEELSSKIPKDAEPEDIPMNVQIEMTALLASIAIVGWIMDCETELQELFSKIRLAVVLDKLKG